MTRRQTGPISLLAFAALAGLAVLCGGCVVLPPTPPPPCVVEHVFKSGYDAPEWWEEASLFFPEDCFGTDTNTIVLENANPAYSGHWLYWDSLSLWEVAGDAVWELGENEAHPEDDSAFDEFQQDPPFEPDFEISTDAHQFPRELNDGNFPRVTIHFDLDPGQADAGLILFLDTLYASHDSVPDFKMRIGVNK